MYNFIMTDNIQITKKQQYQLEVLVRLSNNLITNEDAARSLGISVRQVKRKKKAFRENGIDSLVHGNTGKISNRRYPDHVKEDIVKIYREECPGWNFTHFRYYLEDAHEIKVSDTFIRNILKSQNIKSPKQKRVKRRDHPPRPRKENAGELLQVDASKHQWFGTKEYFYLHGAIDDATGIVTSMVMMKQECTLGYQLVLKNTIEDYGIPECLYTDYRTVFKSNKKLSLDEVLAGKQIEATAFTQLLRRLGTDIISTADPRAKGRIERLWGTMQDQLVHEFVQHKITTMEEANRYIKDIFLPKYNSRYASQIDYNRNRFVKIQKSFDANTELALYWERVVNKNSYIKLNNEYYVVQQNGKPYHFASAKKTRVYRFLDGTLHVPLGEGWLDLKKVPKPETVVKKHPMTKEERSRQASAAAKMSNTPWRRTNDYMFWRHYNKKQQEGGDISKNE